MSILGSGARFYYLQRRFMRLFERTMISFGSNCCLIKLWSAWDLTLFNMIDYDQSVFWWEGDPIKGLVSVRVVGFLQKRESFWIWERCKFDEAEIWQETLSSFREASFENSVGGKKPDVASCVGLMFVGINIKLSRVKWALFCSNILLISGSYLQGSSLWEW